MWVESPPSILPTGGEGKGGPGTTFHFTIQAQTTDLPAHTYLHQVQPELQQRRLLIVDDNETSRLILARQVTAWGMHYRETASPHEALTWLQQGETFDAAIVDLNMPGMDGLTLATEIRRLEAGENRKSRIPLIMLTGSARREITASPAYQAVQFVALLTKPLKASTLYDTLVGLFSEQPGRLARRRDPSSESLFDAQMARRLPLRLLLAEDHPTNQKLALAILARLGYRADIAANGLEAIEALERQPYDLVLMDVQMPEMDGLEATRYIRQGWTARPGPYIIAMTANAMQGDREACLAAGMDDYVSKPIRVEELVTALSRGAAALGSREAGRREILEEAEISASTELSPIPHPPSPISHPLDLSALDRLRDLVDGDEAALMELIGSFLTEMPLLLGKLRQALAAGDAAGLQMAAHTLKSSSNDFGALALAALSQELEAMGKAGILTGAAERVTRVETEYEPVRAALEAILEQQ
jgi:CheY-like chemotaxis protein